MKSLKLLATIRSLAIAGLGILGIVAPAVLIELGQSLNVFRAVAVLPVAVGVFFVYAISSKQRAAGR